MSAGVARSSPRRSPQPPPRARKGRARWQKRDPERSAAEARCVYVDERLPGLTRHRAGRAFTYRDEHGRVVRDRDTLRRIRALVIPPAWTQVWICPLPDGHIQAHGRDARGRKQYRYHARFRAIRDETKYERMLAFGRALPDLRRRVDLDLRKPGLCRDKVLATVVRLLEITLIRIGNDEYARQNGSFGLTTMLNRHVDVDGSTVRFHFRGKSGKQHEVDVHDRRLARLLQRFHDLPGQQLFQWVDDDGNRHPVESADVNAYLKAIGGGDFTAKDFRTWAGTVLVARALAELEAFDSRAAAKRNIVAAVRAVAARLGNTPAVCRRCYVHPEIFDSYLDGNLVRTLRARAEKALREDLPHLGSEEAAVLMLLRDRLAERPLAAALERSITRVKRARSVA